MPSLLLALSLAGPMTLDLTVHLVWMTPQATSQSILGSNLVLILVFFLACSVPGFTCTCSVLFGVWDAFRESIINILCICSTFLLL